MDEPTDRAKRRGRVANVSRSQADEEPEDRQRGEGSGDGVRRKRLPRLIEAHPPGEEEQADAERQRPADEADDVKVPTRGPDRADVGKERRGEKRPKTTDDEEAGSYDVTGRQRPLEERGEDDGQ